MTVAVFAEFVLNGLVLGALYVVMALGLSIIFGMIGIINFAHGALFTLGAYAAFQVKDALGFPATLVVSPLLVGVLGMLIEATLLRRLYLQDPLQGLLLTFGLTMVLEQGIRIVWGRSPKPFDVPTAFAGALSLGPLTYSKYRSFILLAVVALIVALTLFLQKTPVGTIVRAGSGRGVHVHPHGRHPPVPAARAHGRALGKIRVTRLASRVLRHPLTWLYAWFLVLPLLMVAVQSTVSLATEIVVFSLLAIAY